MKKMGLIAGIAVAVILMTIVTLFFLPTQGAYVRHFKWIYWVNNLPTYDKEVVSFNNGVLILQNERAQYEMKRTGIGKVEITVTEKTAKDVCVYSLIGKILTINGMDVNQMIQIVQ